MFRKIWDLRGHDLRQWSFYNVLLGLLPVWLSWFGLAIGGVWKIEAPFIDGTFLIFTATLSGASLSYFTDEVRLGLRQHERWVYNSLLVVLILGGGGFTAIVTLKEFAPARLSDPTVFWVSFAILILAIWFSLNLAAIRLVSGDAQLREQIIEEPRRLAEQAKKANEVGGARL